MMKFIRRFPNAVFFKAPYERSNKQLSFENAMSDFINLLSATIRQKNNS